MNKEAQLSAKYTPDIDVIILLNNFLKQKLNYCFTNVSVVEIMRNKTIVIESINQLMKFELRQYLIELMWKKPYRSLIDNMEHLPQYIDAIVKMWAPSINAAVEMKIEYIQSEYAAEI